MVHNKEIEIVLVEDSPSDAALAIRVLKKHNLASNLLHLKDGLEALDFIFGEGEFEGRNVGNMPKLILLDLKMPKVNGMEFLDRIKSNSTTKAIPVVVFTSSTEDPDVKRCYELGVNSYVVKPVEFTSFEDTIAELGMYWMVYNHSLK